MIEDIPSDIMLKNIKEDIIAALETVYDPEIPVSIWALGLVLSLIHI